MKLIKPLLSLSFAFALTMTSCSSSDDNSPVTPIDPEVKQSQYFLMTLSEGKGPIKNGFLKAYNTLPKGAIDNATGNTTATGGMGGYRQYGNRVYRMFDDNNSRVLGQFVFDEKGFYTTKSIAVEPKIAGSGNFTLTNDYTTGYYFEGAQPTQIQIFDPVGMAKKGMLGDYTDQINALEMKLNLQGVNFKAIGQHFLAINGNKLYADITFGKNQGAQGGMFDGVSKDVHIAVIDLTNGKWIGDTSVKNTGNIAFVDENPLYYFDENKDLYFVCQGIKTGGLGDQSKIARIKNNSNEVDQTWELDFNTMFSNVSSGKFSTIYVEKGKIVTLVNDVPLTNPQTINLTPIWKYVVIDIKTKTVTPIEIEGVTLVETPAAALGVSKIDNKKFIRVVNDTKLGYYELSNDLLKATPSIEIQKGGKPQGLFKVDKL
ncbi:hypothetical protein SAMN04488018_1074 [Myroides marinus]|uniref:DUF4374 domain-containing protein n=1 Tax=Myroides marinus TaxID=703342 RepID=A0A1H6UIG2_9FLAO|nr:hypothetical protein [Myroides marinus]SEI92113.1 hypothetical protein SAMN04488018_1074 [Myroides marinus]